ncbi:magnesium transporter [Pseudomonas sp. C27(2019)]|mgnify:CR=1 FL=1|uniref:magnesium transporter n=1 Tax=Pseudomonas sp. C27(2019) TaxID=2604941 RepID=UPI001244468D|nr:magnesium transporter [Pseudomonas sp. C27(2019)]QEY57681.1 magnesium transporter [Pseudomonas sp. C27(2019)]
MDHTDTTLTLALSDAIGNNDFDSALAAVKSLRPVDLADVLEQLEPTLCWRLLERLPKRAEVFSYIEADEQVRLAREFPRATLAELVSEMPADERTDLFKRFDQNQRDILLPALAQAEREDIRKLSAYVEGTAGALMTSDYAALKQDMSVAQSLAYLRDEAPDAETIYQVYVIDDERRLLGVVSLRDLILADLNKTIEDLMTSDVVSADVGDDQEDIAKKIARYDLLALPIIDEIGVLIGIVTYDDAMDVVSAEATDDIHKSAGVSTVIGNLKDASIGLLYRKRVFWLVLLVFGNLFSGAGIAHFEDIIAANIVLVFFLPLLVDSGGNAGSQSATLMVRALATGEVVMRDWLHLIGREALVALALGCTMAAAVSVLGYVRGDETVALVLALSMVSIVMIGCMIGMSLPFVLSKFNFDPASASAPLITSVCDATGVVTYLFIASRLLADLSVVPV